MLALILGLLGAGGAVGIALRVLGWAGTLQKLKAFAGGAKRTAKRVPWKVWLALAIAAALVGAYLLHRHVASTALAAAYNDGYAKGGQAERDAIATAQAAIDAQATAINSKVRKANDATNRAIARDADALRLRGPGQAACPGVGAAPRPAGGHEPASRPAAAAVDQVPGRERVELIAVPYGELLDRAEQCDANRAEVLSWRQADDLQRALARPSAPTGASVDRPVGDGRVNR